MDWLVLICSGGLEAVWAIALDRSESFTRIGPTAIFVAGLVASMFGLSYAVRTINLGTAYSVWVGIGAALTVTYGIATGAESFSWIKVALLAVLIGSMIGLKLTGDAH